MATTTQTTTAAPLVAQSTFNFDFTDNAGDEDAPQASVSGIGEYDPIIRPHLQKLSDPMADAPAVCLFQETGDCGGVLMNGYCSEHLRLLNIHFVSGSKKIYGANGHSVITSFMSPCAAEPGPISNEPRYYRIFPVPEMITGDISTISLGFDPTNAASLKIVRMSAQLVDIINNGSITRRHFGFWRDYISNRFNADATQAIRESKNVASYVTQSRAVPVFMFVNTTSGDGGTNTSLLDLSKCSLITQTFLTLFQPQALRTDETNPDGRLAAPANIQIIDGYVCINTSLIPFGTDVCRQAIGTTLRAPTAQGVRYIKDSLNNHVNLSYTYPPRADSAPRC